MTLRAGLLLLCCPLVGCATARVVRLDTGEGTPIVYTPARRIPPVEIDQRAFEKAMTTLLLEMKLSLSDEGHPHLRFASATEEPGGRYHRWCSQQSSPDECLGLLQGGFSLADAGVRRQLALSFAWDGVWDGVASEVRGIVNPVMLKLMISTAFAAYVGLLILPEPVTKVVAVALTAFLIAYVGVEVFCNIVEGWRELSARSERAQSFRELEDAGHRFGDVMGRDGARVIILAMTAALGGGAVNLASKAPTLPAFAQAALAARTNVGFELSGALAGGVRSVAVAEGGITIGLAPGVVAAVATGSPGGAIRPGGLGPGAAQVNPLEGTTYTGKVRAQMRPNPKTGKPDNHGFPLEVDNSAGLGRQTTIMGGDGVTRTKVELDGSYNGQQGTFEWIIEPDGTVNHRLFVPKSGGTP